MIASKVSSKSQVTLPREVRKHLKLKQGDVIVYTVADEAVVMRKASPIDVAYLSAIEATLGEWSSPDDEQAFRDL